MLLGAIYGMILKWGPILWGLIGLIGGLLLGFLFKLMFLKKQNQKTAHVTTEVFLLIHCNHELKQLVEEILWDNLSNGIAKLGESLEFYGQTNGK